MKMITHWGSALILGLASLTAQATVQVLEIDSVTVDREKDRIYIEGSWFKPVTSPGTPIVRLGGQDLKVQSATGTLIQARLPRKLEDGEYTLFVGQATGGVLGALEVETTSATYSLTLNSGCTVSACQNVNDRGIAVMRCGDSEINMVCALPDKLVFVVFDDRPSEPLGGLQVADALCQADAEAAYLPGQYLAWLSDEVDSPARRFTKSLEPYRLPDGTVVANSWTDLTDGTLAHAIDQFADGAPVAHSVNAVTGTDTDGEAVPGFNCENWTQTSGVAVYGAPGRSDYGWSNLFASGSRCASSRYIYCFGQ